MNGIILKKLISFFFIGLIEIEFRGERSGSLVTALSSSPSDFFRRLNHEPKFRSTSYYDSDEDDDSYKYSSNGLQNKKGIMTMKFHKDSGRSLLFHRLRPFYSSFLHDSFSTRPFLSHTKQPNDKLFIVLEDESKCEKNDSKTEINDRSTGPEEPAPLPAPKTQTGANQVKPQPSPCIWAIIGCCAPTNYHFWYGCFQYLGCTAAFWEVDPCQLSIVLFASRQAVSYYEQFEKPQIHVTFTTSRATSPPSDNNPTTETTITENSTTATTTQDSTLVTPQETPKTEEPTTTTTVQTTTLVPSTEQATTVPPA